MPTINLGKTLCVFDALGREYILPPEGTAGGQGIMFPLGNLAVKLALDDNRTGVKEDLKAAEKYQVSMAQLMSLPSLPHLSQPIALIKPPYSGYVMEFMNGLEPLDAYSTPFSQEDGGYLRTLLEKGGLLKRIRILRNLAEILANVHNNGLVYCDLSLGNVFVSKNPDEAETWLIDTDNLCRASKCVSHWQTPYSRAPEIFNGSCNSQQSDCYSFALIAYKLLTFANPFETANDCDDENDDECGWDDASADDSNPVSDPLQDKIESGAKPYVYEGNIDENPPIGMPLKYVASVKVQQLFMETFGKKGRLCPLYRPSMNDWRKAFDQQIDTLIYCPKCTEKAGNKRKKAKYTGWHIASDEVCPFCGNPVPYYSAKIYQATYLISSSVKDEDGEADSFSERLSLVGEVCVNAVAGVRIPIKWKYIAGSEKKHVGESNALILSVGRDSKVNFTDKTDSELEVVRMQGKNNQIAMRYKDIFYYKIVVEGN